MRRLRLTRRIARPIRDFTFGLILSVLFLSSIAVEQASHRFPFVETAPTHLLTSTPAAPVMAFALNSYVVCTRLIQEISAVSLLVIVFASLVALNFWFARHLCRAYVGRGLNGTHL